VRSLTPFHRLPEIRQAAATECGLACLAMIASYYGRHTDLNALRREYPVSLKGATLATVMEIATKLGFAGRPLRLEIGHLRSLRLPAILHWDMNHFVVLRDVGRSGLTIHDPAFGIRRYGFAEVSKHFTGIALELAPDGTFRPRRAEPKLSLFDVVCRMTGLVPVLVQILALSLVLQLYVLASPFYMQIVVDNAIAKDDHDFLLVLALGFALFLLINTGATLLRAKLLTYAQSALAFQMGTGLFRHLLRLPMSYFEKRYVGDLVSRFTSAEPIRNLLAEGLVTTLIDGAMAVLTAGMMFLYRPALTLVVLAALAFYFGLRVAFYHLMRRRSLDLIEARSRESTTFIETMRAVQSIKIFAREQERSAVWTNRYAAVVQAEAASGFLKQSFQVANGLIFGLENIVVIYLGALAVLTGDMTVGMLFAFISYKQQFVDKAARLVERAIEYRMLDLHLERLSDIAGAEPEKAHHRPAAYQPPIAGDLEIRDLCFRYAEGESFILQNVNLHIRAGEYVAITGASGCGKTTLLKVILGLLEPTSGEILIDGVPLPVLGYEVFRKNIGVVMQDDQMLSGSIADNICFFDETFDLDYMVRCARLAGIHDDICRMPMAYNSPIGDMGTSLSGGQKQRILLARALYRRPRILFMDEGTSHLDVATERWVTAAVRALGLTRIIIAHRPETIASAQRRFVLGDGRLSEQPDHRVAQTDLPEEHRDVPRAAQQESGAPAAATQTQRLPVTAPAPSNDAGPAPSPIALPPALVELALAELARVIGPIAHVLAERDLPACTNAAELWARLAAHIEPPAERAAFLRRQPDSMISSNETVPRLLGWRLRSGMRPGRSHPAHCRIAADQPSNAMPDRRATGD
jgi:ATP-binding cassette subfamily B protein RaxB